MSAGWGWRFVGVFAMIVGLNTARADGWSAFVLAVVFGVGVSLFGESILAVTREERKSALAKLWRVERRF